MLDAARTVRGRGYREFPQIYPRPGEVEHDPEEIWASVHGRARRRARAASTRARIAAIGITNQRETTLLWDRADGRPVANAIVWQDRRTAPLCAELKAAGHEPALRERTGLVLDPYFSATKIRWMLDNVAGLRARAEARRARVRHRRQLPGLAARRAATCTRPTSPTRRARCCSTSARGASIRRAVRAVRRAAGDAARGLRVGGAARRDAAACPGCPTASRSRASPAISRRRCSARPARSRATRSARTAPARSC